MDPITVDTVSASLGTAPSSPPPQPQPEPQPEPQVVRESISVDTYA